MSPASSAPPRAVRTNGRAWLVATEAGRFKLRFEGRGVQVTAEELFDLHDLLVSFIREVRQGGRS